ncbi:MAG: hypothetical protein GC200_01295 [Tepidisphaera sp.]|nr:hypothetical protein [Tepidisphaera sp.]
MFVWGDNPWTPWASAWFDLCRRLGEHFAPCTTRRWRAWRVNMLLIASLILALGDLWMTLAFASNMGMLEANPIARLVMGMGSTAGIIAWKLATTLLGLGILYHLRHTRHAEIGAWVVFGVLTALSIHWLNYTELVTTLGSEYQRTLAMSDDPRYVMLGPQ